MKIQLIVLAANQDDSSNERKKSRGANKIFTNKYCIPSKNAFIMYKINFINCFKWSVAPKLLICKEYFELTTVPFKQVLYLQSQKYKISL
jgi:hypothetical protein